MFLKSKATGCGLISTVFSVIVLLCVSSTIIITIIKIIIIIIIIITIIIKSIIVSITMQDSVRPLITGCCPLSQNKRKQLTTTL